MKDIVVMRGRKQSIIEFEKLSPGLGDSIPSIDEKPELVTANGKLREIEEQAREAERKLNSYYEPFSEKGQSAALPTVESDAQKILNGVAIATLPTKTEENQRQILVRQRDVLKQAFEIQKDNIRLLKAKLIREGCKELEPVARRFMADTVAGFESVLQALRRQEVFFRGLNQKGYETGYCPTHWQSIPYEIMVLYGCGAIGLTSLEYYLQNRKNVWGLEDAR